MNYIISLSILQHECHLGTEKVLAKVKIYNKNLFAPPQKKKKLDNKILALYWFVHVELQK